MSFDHLGIFKNYLCDLDFAAAGIIYFAPPWIKSPPSLTSTKIESKVAGVSMGGNGSPDCIARYPERFAGGIVSRGGGDENTVTPAVAQVPVWLFHSDNDPTVPVVRARHMVAAMKKMGGQPHYTEFSSLGMISETKLIAKLCRGCWISGWMGAIGLGRYARRGDDSSESHFATTI